MYILLMMMLTISFIFIWLNHPISMGVTIIAQTLIISMIAGMSLGSFWFSYIIVITMLSGMLVLFIYMASVASNEKFFNSIKLVMFSILMLTMGVMLQFYSQDFNQENLNIQTSLSVETISLNNLFNTKFKLITMTMVLYLLFTMITVSYIVNISEGPLRVTKK